MLKNLRNTVLALLCLGGAAPALADDADRWLFRVYLDDREIGFHEFAVRDLGGRREVEVTARFDVRILFFNAYRYDHRNRETWYDDCLEGIESTTDDNGDAYRVNGRVDAGDFVLETHIEAARIDAPCVQTFAYWNPAILEAERLLNAQTGEWVDVAIRPEGAVTLDIGPHRVAAEKYTIEMDDGPIRLWYSPGGRHWLALEAETAGGRTLRYVPLALPWNAVTEHRLAMD